MNSTLQVSEDGVKSWSTTDGDYHKENEPAITFPDGSEEWWFKGWKHRIDGPAFIDTSNKRIQWFWFGEYFEKQNHPFNVFCKEYELSDVYEEWPNDMKMLFKLSYG